MQLFSRARMRVGAAALAALAAPPAQAIFGGTTDTAHRAVVMVLNETEQLLCSGVLIAPTVVLTAAHCLVGDATPGDYLVSFATAPQTLGDFVSVASLHAHPSFAADPVIVHDVGVLLLTDPASETPLRWLDADPGGVYQVGTEVDAAGYGSTSLGTGDGTRRSASINVDQVSPTTFEHDQTDGKGPCQSDAGGPAIALVASRPTVIGTFSYGDQSCATQAVYQRTDAESAFIEQFAPEPGATALAAAALGALAVAARRRG